MRSAGTLRGKAIASQLSVISYQLSVISYQLSVISFFYLKSDFTNLM
ncbi:MAG: hypothetical protein O4808_07535 [Trichodesmium sp. St17_bin3_1_1]|nr:hypothetical protein [Trichodesmium sp. St17_bin3_1_1]MDE5118773.1 hypothetical protein [Trichodesmium sp. St19_bin1]